MAELFIIFLMGIILILTRMLTVAMRKDRDPVDPETPEGFLKFVEDSREWAFDYIENAQKVLTEITLNADSLVGKANKKRSTKPELVEIINDLKVELDKIKGLLP
jgi:hypothetical protein